MVTVKQLHCSQRPEIIIYSDNMSTWKRTSNVYSDPKEWLHLSMMRNHRMFSKHNNKQQWSWNNAIVLGEKQWWFIAIILSLGNILAIESVVSTLQYPAGITTFWRYHYGAIVLSILTDFWQVVHQQKEEGIEVQCWYKIFCHRRRRCYCRGWVHNKAIKEVYMATIWLLSIVVWM